MLEVAAKKHLGAFTLDAKFELPTPGVVALFGRSGCGKSTLINVIAGLLKAAGRVALDDAVLLDTEQNIDIPPQHRRIGYVFQEARLFPHFNVAGNLRYAERRAGAPAFVSFDLVIDLLDLGALMSRRTHQLSGGERQRVAIGRALLSQPRLMLLDEPLASLDASRREEVLPYLEILRDQLAIPMVYVSHNFDEVLRLATYLVLMESGKTVAQGGIADMSLNSGVRAIIGADAVGAVVDGTVLGMDPSSGLTRVGVGSGELKVLSETTAPGSKLRVQLLARDLIVATRAPQQLSVRNILTGVVTAVTGDEGEADLIAIDIGGTTIMARVTHAATRELKLTAGLPVWALVKSLSLRSRSFEAARPAAPDPPAAPTPPAATAPPAPTTR
ncbi:MAG TPA: molybdenum ABC transporter ATP-binding protein [Steroidobacteraceae bacterium]|jgi:molybdate transport system ATP-binding protein|nr:molybdenum ABC transporter ATP-binding protein [Steroidobacteraceae bacterium]